MSDFASILKLREYKRGYNPPADNILFKIQGENIGCTQSLVIFSGLPKSGKSTFLTACLASSITGQTSFTMELKPDPKRPKIAFFDTESSEVDFYRHIDRIKLIAGVKELPQNIRAFCTRPDDAKMQIRLINEYLLLEPDTSILFIDGLLDLCVDFNDVTESKKIMNWIKFISVKFNLLIISVLHTGKDGLQRLGHLGANTDRTAQSVLQIKKDENKFILDAKFLRSAKGIIPIVIEYDNSTNSYTQINKAEIESKQHWQFYTLEQHNKKLDNFFIEETLVTYDNFIKQIKRVENRGINYCKDYFKYLKDKNFISQNVNGFWHDSRILF